MDDLTNIQLIIVIHKKEEWKPRFFITNFEILHDD